MTILLSATHCSPDTSGRPRSTNSPGPAVIVGAVPRSAKYSTRCSTTPSGWRSTTSVGSCGAGRSLADEDGAAADAEANEQNRTASLNEVNGAIDVRASGGSAMTAAEMLGIFEQFAEVEFRNGRRCPHRTARPRCARLAAPPHRRTTPLRCVEGDLPPGGVHPGRLHAHRSPSSTSWSISTPTRSCWPDTV